ncbi:MAG: radical SAM protein [Candidatus Krumholzibacteria bacterium]|nr:radical SAM protein [Candidatus Krumholzibacteria bacterium]
MIQPAHPRFIQIETTLACNAECPFCTHHTLTRRPRRMHEDVWKKIVDETRGLGMTYRPFLINEPLSDMRLAEIMRYIRQDPTARIELNTNGELMKEQRAREILEARVDVIRFSVDGFSKETFEKSRVGLDYDTTVWRTFRFIQMAKELGGAGRIEVRMIDMDYNKHEQEAFVEFWTKAGAEALVTDLYLWPWEPGVQPVQKPCKKVLDEMFIYVNGKATLCCWDSHERGVVGDVTREHVLEVWNGAVNQHYRSLLAEGRRAEILLCSRCEAYKHHYFEGFDSPPASAHA